MEGRGGKGLAGEEGRAGVVEGWRDFIGCKLSGPRASESKCPFILFRIAAFVGLNPMILLPYFGTQSGDLFFSTPTHWDSIRGKMWFWDSTLNRRKIAMWHKINTFAHCRCRAITSLIVYFLIGQIFFLNQSENTLSMMQSCGIYSEQKWWFEKGIEILLTETIDSFRMKTYWRKKSKFVENRKKLSFIS